LLVASVVVALPDPRTNGELRMAQLG
jgi:hypothetical protein